MNVYLPGTGFATQGPCPDGFHVPLKSEWDNVYNAGVNLGVWSSSSGSGMRTYLKMPYCGVIRATDGTVINRDVVGQYWSSTNAPNNGSYRYGYNTYLYSSTLVTSSTGPRSAGLSIRPFKNTPVVPDSGWTTLYQGSGSAGIYQDTTNGLISLSSDGSTWYTISDKNLGATVVYNYGDTLSESNCGKYYQRGNNYGFAFTGPTTTSSTNVNASTYGPGNYYSSSTFIYNTYGVWDTSDNNNLRGGVDGNVQVVNELKNAYIGEYKEIVCDFTQSDYGFTYYGRLSGIESYGRGSSGLYLSNTGNYGGVGWSVPSSIYSEGTLKKAVFTFKGSCSHHGGGFSLKSGNGIDQYMIRYFGSLRVKYANQNNYSSATAVPPPTNTNRTFTVDFENKILSSSVSGSGTLALDDNTITAFNNDWSNGRININALFADSSNVTVYIPKIIFIF